MEVREVKERIATMSVTELSEVEAFIHDLKYHRYDHSAPAKTGITFEEAAGQVQTEYAHLLRKLSQ